MWIFCGDFALNFVESLALNGVLDSAFMWIIYARQQSPERSSRGFTDEPACRVASKLEDTRFKAAKPKFLVWTVRVYFTKDVLITLGLTDGMTVCSMNLEYRLNNLKTKTQF
jgi:hypothetical protein